MEVALAAVAETLMREFEDLPSSTVIAVLSECTDEFPYDGPHFIEQAARARLLLICHPQRGGTGPLVRDSLDVSLHDSELAHEVELTGRLMVAANESGSMLTQAQVDRVLGVPRRLWPTVPAQATAGLERGHYQSFRTRS